MEQGEFVFDLLKDEGDTALPDQSALREITGLLISIGGKDEAAGKDPIQSKDSCCWAESPRSQVAQVRPSISRPRRHGPGQAGSACRIRLDVARHADRQLATGMLQRR